MAHPTIKIDTSVQAQAQAHKRGLPEESEDGLNGVGDKDDPALEQGDTENVPSFLCQSVFG